MRKGLLLAFALLLCSSLAPAAPPKPKPKPPPTHPTVQLAGDNGKMGTVYSISKSNPIYFRLKSAEYTTDQVLVGEQMYVPKADEKLLVLHFTIQNPQKTQRFTRFDSLRFTVVDAANTNHDGTNVDWGDETAAPGKRPSHQTVSLQMMPAQTIDVYMPMTVPAAGIIPKLMVLPPGDNDGPILRYDLTAPQNKATPLSPPIADPSDPYTALDTVPGQLNATYPYQDFDVTVQKFEYTTSALDSDPPEEGGRFLIVTILTHNDSYREPVLRFDTFTATLTSTDGETLKYNDMLLATANRTIDIQPKTGADTTVRIYFTVPKDVTPKTLALKEGESRTYEFEVK